LEEDSSDDESSDEEAMHIAIQQSLGIPVPMPAKKIAHKKTVEDKKPAAKKVTDAKKPTSKPKVTVDTLYGNKMMSGGITIKQDKATGKVNLIQEFDKEAQGQTSKPKESKSRKQNRKDKEKSVASSETVKGQQSQQGERVVNADKSTHLKQTNDSTKSSVAGGNKTDDTNVPTNPNDQVPLKVPSKGESTGGDLSDQGKLESDVSSSQAAQSNPDHQSDKKMTAQQ
jgi:hypothetical protein